MKKTLLCSLVCLCFALPLLAQKDTEPKTKMEAFENQNGVVLVEEFSEIGSVAGKSTIRIEAHVIRDAVTGKKVYGAKISLIAEGGAGEATLDFEELEPLLKALDYCLKIDRSSTKLASVESYYKTNGGLVIGVFSVENGDAKAMVRCKSFPSSAAFITVDKLKEFQELIQTAKIKLAGLMQEKK